MVLAGDGSPTEVVGVYPQGVRPLYRLTFDDGASVVATGDHLWSCVKGRARFGANRGHESWETLSTDEVIAWGGLVPKPPSRIAIPAPGSCQFSETGLPVDPYLLGALLGDGCLTNVTPVLTNPDKEVVGRCIAGLPAGVTAKQCSELDYRLSGNGGTNPLTADLRALGVMGKYSYEKSVPEPYLFAAPAERLALLHGLMDTDGTATAKGCVSYTSTSLQLAEDVVFLVRSFGGKAKIGSRQTHYTHNGEKRAGRVSYRVRIRCPHVPVFSLPRKARRTFKPSSTSDNRILYRIEPVEPGEATCIRVAHPSHTFITEDFIVTHNSVAGGYEANCHLLGRHPYRPVPPPPSRGLIVVGIIQEHWPIVSEKIRHTQPAGALHVDCKYVEGKGYMFRGRRMIGWANGSTATPKSGKQSVVALASGTYDWLWIDEPPTSTHWGEALSRVSSKLGPVWLTFTPIDVAQDLRWLRHKLELTEGHESEHDPGWEQVVIGLNVDDCPHRSAESIAEQMSVYLEWERVQRTTGGWEGISGGRMLSNFDGTQVFRFTGWHDLPGLDPGEELRVGMVGDHGENAAKEFWLLYVYQQRARQAWVVGEYASPAATTVEQDAARLVELLGSKGLSVAEVDRWTGDVNTMGKSQLGRVNDEFERALGLSQGAIRNAVKVGGSVVWGSRVVNYAFGQRKLWVADDLAELLNAIRRWNGGKTGEDSGHKDKIDALRYGPGEVLEGIMPRVAVGFR